MASHSPTESEEEIATAAPNSTADYRLGWQNITRLMDSGSSWSGSEHNCAFLNLGDRSFVDISAAAGLDHVQDGRAVANFDWDGDGDLDLWLKSRNGRQLRLLENRMPGGKQFLALRLRGTTCNRDAFGARVVVTAGKRTYVQELRCGEGYLSQSTAELLFGMQAGVTLESVVVHWPGGEAEEFEGVQSGVQQRLIQGHGSAETLPPRETIIAEAQPLPKLSASTRVVLRTPLPLPTSIQRKYFDSNKSGARLINLWATWCEPCVRELGDLAQHSDELAAMGLEILPLCLDSSEDGEAARALFEGRIVPQMGSAAPFDSRNLSVEERSFFEALFEHMIAKAGAMPVPASLLVDQHGLVEILYLGPVDVETLIEDVATYGLQPETVGVRCNYPGRWFYGMPRNLEQLSKSLSRRKLGSSASYYAALHKMTLRR